MDDAMQVDGLKAGQQSTEQAPVRAPYEAPTVLTVQGALTTLLGSAAECTVTEPGPEQDFA